MKPAVIALALTLLPLSPALAEVDRKGQFNCQAENGKKILVNDEFTGRGRALISGMSRPFYAIPIDGPTGRLHFLISSGERAYAATYSLRLDTAMAEVTFRKEGKEFAEYYYVPADFVATNFWGKEEIVATKCFQAVK